MVADEAAVDDPLFSPRLAVASLSGESDADWALAAADHVGAAFLGGVALDEATRAAAREMVADRDRTEFLPPDPLAFVARELDRLAEVPLRAGVNVRAATPGPIREVAAVCAARNAILEVNAHCRQAEMCDAGAGQSLLGAPERLSAQVAAAADAGATVSVKVRAEVEGVDLPALARRLDRAGAAMIHVDAMDSEAVVREVAAATDCAVVANNGVRDAATAREYLAYGADAVSVGRPSDRPAVLRRVRRAVDGWFAREAPPGDGDVAGTRDGEPDAGTESPRDRGSSEGAAE